jgi:LmbE family N-acetylglucosaminyl deacetylase
MTASANGSVDEPGQPAQTPGIIASTWSRNLARPAVALAVGAHPDDVEFGCGATLAKWAAAGTLVHHLVLTDGSKGSWDPDRDIEELVSTRRDEQRAAAAALGGGDVTFLGHLDGELTHSTDVVAAVAHEIRRIRPGVVLGHDPWKRYRLHPDHRHAGFIVTDAIVAARDPHFLRDSGLAHHRPDALLLWEADEPNHVEDVTAHVEVKLRALRAHESQFESTMKALDDEQLAAFGQRIRNRLGDLGRPFDMDAAEVFKLIADL